MIPPLGSAPVLPPTLGATSESRADFGRESRSAASTLSTPPERDGRGPAAIVALGDSSRAGPGLGELSEEEKRIVAQMKARDREVRRHEQAHANAGGPYAGVPSYSTERGPDRHLYAVAGTTPVDASPVSGNPAATIRKMEMVKRAALAPADPSGQDRAVAGQAAAERTRAQTELAQERAAERAESLGIGEPGRGDPETASPSSTPPRARRAIADYQRAAQPSSAAANPDVGAAGGSAAAGGPILRLFA